MHCPITHRLLGFIETSRRSNLSRTVSAVDTQQVVSKRDVTTTDASNRTRGADATVTIVTTMAEYDNCWECIENATSDITFDLEADM